eukprot:TRINITY_DN50094_c0_g1_i1.p1 TRINITY_DN50094_c0_g1~~TRINITY_DN50094_c0_g1_i1.p1  ORF type:complete len:573 (+),score=120.12 TRINITY_DN50094_c0_g1_i1:91-1809(+)
MSSAPIWQLIPGMLASTKSGRIVYDAALCAGAYGVYDLLATYPVWQPYAAGTVVVAMVAWRVLRRRQTELPYCCASATTPCGRELVVVGTMHISPKSPIDVANTMSAISPEAVLIELCPQRLKRLRMDAPPPPPGSEPLLAQQCAVVSFSDSDGDAVLPADQLLELRVPDGEPTVLHSVPAGWNGGRVGETIRGALASEAAPGVLAALELKHGSVLQSILHAHEKGAAAVVFLHGGADHAGEPRAASQEYAARIEVLYTWREMWAAVRRCQWHYPPLPSVLLTPADSAVARRHIRSPGCVTATLTVKQPSSSSSASTVRCELCTKVGLIASGILVLYGLMRCAGVRAGQEFLAAEDAAKKQEKCVVVCCDVSTTHLGKSVVRNALPWPRNLLRSLRMWLALPRALLRLMFPDPHYIDSIGAMIQHCASLSCRTWAAFITAAVLVNLLVTAEVWLLGQLFSKIADLLRIDVLLAHIFASKGDAASTKAPASAGSSSQWLALWLLPILELYLLPVIKSAVLDDRDEFMYRNAVRAFDADKARQKVVLVCGCAHANGILRRARSQGLRSLGEASV